MDDEVAEQYLLDSILTLVDAKHAADQLNDRQEARRQVGFADQIFISKADLVSQDEVDALIHRLKHMNPRAPMRPVHFGEVALKEVFDLRGFNLNAKLDIDPDFLNVDDHAHDHHDHEHHDHDHEHGRALQPPFAPARARPWPPPSPRRRCEKLSSTGPTSRSTLPSWRTFWAPSCRSTAPRCCATRAC